MSQNCLTNQNFTNWAQNITIRPHRRCSPNNLDDLVVIVQEAQSNGRHVRAVGTGWSFSDVMVTQDYLVSLSEHINRPLAFSQGNRFWGELENVPQVLSNALNDSVRRSNTKLVHVESGITIRALYLLLESQAGSANPRLALLTMGGSGGQTLAGAISTGTHGGDFDLPPLADSVRAIHLVAPDGTQHWIERSGNASITNIDALLAVLPNVRRENVHYDDDWFNSVLVSMGCMGIIYSLVIEVREQFGLSQRVGKASWQQVRQWLLNRENFAELPPGVEQHPESAPPRFLEILLNPYRESNNYSSETDWNRRCLLVSRAESTRIPVSEYTPPQINTDNLGIFWDLEVNSNSAAFSSRVNQIIEGSRTNTSGFPVSWSVMDQYRDSTPLPVRSLEMVFSTEGDRHILFIDRMLAIFDNLVRQGKLYAGFMAIRFTRPSSASLSMQSDSSVLSDLARFCHIEMSPLQDFQPHPNPHKSESYSDDFLRSFEDVMVEFGGKLHWGQLSLRDKHTPQKYSEFSRWMRIRDELTQNGVIHTFDNDFTTRYGIAAVTPGWKALKGMFPTIPTTAPDDYPRQTQSLPPTILRNRTGCLEVFALGGDGQVCWTRQNSPNNEYLKWKVVSPSPITCTGHITAANHLSSRGGERRQPHLFVRSVDGKIYKAHRDDDSSSEWSWGEFGEPGFVSSPVVAYDEQNQMHVYALHSDGRVLRRNQDNKPLIGWGWGNWAELRHPPVRFTDNLAVANNQDKRMEVFARDEAGRIWHSWQLDLSTEPESDRWSQWVQLGSLNGLGDPVTAKNADGRIEVFARRGGEIWHMWQTAPSNGWNTDWVRLENFISNASTNPDVILAGQRLHMAALDNVGGVRYLSQSSPNTWQAAIPAFLGVLVADSFSPPALGENAEGRTEVFVKTASDIIQHGYVSNVVVNPACKAWIWANQPTATSYTPDRNYQYNSAGGINQIVRLGVGQYRVKLPRLGRSGGMVHVSAYQGNHYCKVVNWNSSRNNQFVNVNCFSPNGTPIDGQFVMLFYKGVQQSASWTDAYLWASEPTAAAYTPNSSYQWNSKGLVNTIRRIGTGHYQVTLPGMNVAGGTVLVTAYGAGTERCKVGGWNRSGNDTIVDVYCFSVDGNPVDTRFTLSFMNDVDLGVPEPEGWWSGSYVWADQPTETDYVPDTNYQQNTDSNTPNRIKRFSTGSYQVHFPNLSLVHSTTQVTAYGSGSEYCTVEYWIGDGSNGTIVSVQCFDSSGTLVDTQFTLMHC